MIRKLLSYPMTEDAPGWPGNPKLRATPYSAIAAGDTANQFKVELFNHYGSHMDAPNHFVDRGLQMWQLPVSSFFYDRPLLLDIPKGEGELVLAEEVLAYRSELQEADLLLIRSGFSVKRDSDPTAYSERGPGFSSRLCQVLMDEFPKLKAVGMDWISLSSVLHPDEGVQAHRFLLGEYHEHFKLIIEDLDLRELSADRLRRVVALPLLIRGVDSGPCTVVAELAVLDSGGGADE
ncbi:cyclase family protein [Paenibacillus koleovorans]|uniref:cyclase family protein n=1 Tax=Paenibacillus koleovorans TaxID=121608 RepID=UPI000FDABD97|nr:cyclase family protein [Paenibacillus koleovorans]